MLKTSAFTNSYTCRQLALGAALGLCCAPPILRFVLSTTTARRAVVLFPDRTDASQHRRRFSSIPMVNAPTRKTTPAGKFSGLRERLQ
jgi:hypothetical protein